MKDIATNRATRRLNEDPNLHEATREERRKAAAYTTVLRQGLLPDARETFAAHQALGRINAQLDAEAVEAARTAGAADTTRVTGE